MIRHVTGQIAVSGSSIAAALRLTSEHIDDIQRVAAVNETG
jgi:pilus assembly protein TadC